MWLHCASSTVPPPLCLLHCASSNASPPPTHCIPSHSFTAAPPHFYCCTVGSLSLPPCQSLSLPPCQSFSLPPCQSLSLPPFIPLSPVTVALLIPHHTTLSSESGLSLTHDCHSLIISHSPVTMASLSPSLFGLIRTNSCQRLFATSELLSTNSRTGWSRLNRASSST